MTKINKLYQKYKKDNLQGSSFKGEVISKTRKKLLPEWLTFRLVRWVVLFGFLGYAGFAMWRFPPAQRVFVGNMGATSFAVGWNTQRTSRGCVVVYKDLGKPGKWIWKCEKELAYTHLVEVKGLEPESEYGVIVIDGVWVSFKRIVPVNTKPISEQAPPLPQPAYGSVTDPNGIGADRALVVLYPESSEFVYPILGLTNDQGRYAFDLGEVVYSKEYLRLEAVASGGVWAEQKTLTNLTQPVPSIKVVAK